MGSVLLCAGLSLLLLSFDNKWVDIAGFFAILISTMLLKKKMIEENKDYGIYIYYTLMTLWLLIVFIKWFM